MGVVTLKGEEEIFFFSLPGHMQKEMPCEDTARSQLSTGLKEASWRTELVSLLTLDLQASRTVRNKLVLFKPPSLWYSVMAAQAY